jgi:rod shape-determining protein MreB
MDEAIVNYIKRKHGLFIGERSAEQLKIAIGTAYPDGDVRTMHVKGRDLVAGIPRTIEIDSEEVREAIAEPVNIIVEAVRVALEQTPPELAADIMDKGIVLAGGGALIRNLDILLREETGLPIMIADDPLCAVALGSGKALDQIDILSQVRLS